MNESSCPQLVSFLSPICVGSRSILPSARPPPASRRSPAAFAARREAARTHMEGWLLMASPTIASLNCRQKIRHSDGSGVPPNRARGPRTRPHRGRGSRPNQSRRLSPSKRVRCTAPTTQDRSRARALIREALASVSAPAPRTLVDPLLLSKAKAEDLLVIGLHRSSAQMPCDAASPMVT
jgi:hypothetical protein